MLDEVVACAAGFPYSSPMMEKKLGGWCVCVCACAAGFPYSSPMMEKKLGGWCMCVCACAAGFPYSSPMMEKKLGDGVCVYVHVQLVSHIALQ